jgi:hypothetical protein
MALAMPPGRRCASLRRSVPMRRSHPDRTVIERTSRQCCATICTRTRPSRWAAVIASCAARGPYAGVEMFATGSRDPNASRAPSSSLPALGRRLAMGTPPGARSSARARPVAAPGERWLIAGNVRLICEHEGSPVRFGQPIRGHARQLLHGGHDRLIAEPLRFNEQPHVIDFLFVTRRQLATSVSWRKQ